MNKTCSHSLQRKELDKQASIFFGKNMKIDLLRLATYDGKIFIIHSSVSQ